jgi:hypothetical protein
MKGMASLALPPPLLAVVLVCPRPIERLQCPYLGFPLSLHSVAPGCAKRRVAHRTRGITFAPFQPQQCKCAAELKSQHRRT